MPRQEFRLPPFNPDRSEGSVYETNGLISKPIDRRGNVVYVRGTSLRAGKPPGDFRIDYEYEHTVNPVTQTADRRRKVENPGAGEDLRMPPLGLLREMYAAGELLPPERQLTFLCYDGVEDLEQSTVYYVDLADNLKIKALPLAHNAGDEYPKIRAFPFVAEDQQYLMFGNGRMIRVDNGALAQALTADDFREAVEEIETDILAKDDQDQFIVPELQNNLIADVEYWQRRLFISLNSTVHWSDVGNLKRWARTEIVNEGEDNEYVERTLAGFFTLDREKIRALAVSGRALQLFSSSQLYRANVSDVEVQFTVVPAIQSLDYLTAEIQFRNGVYYLSQSGIRFVADGTSVSRVISLPINEWLQAHLNAETHIGVGVIEDTSSVAWMFPERRAMAIFSTKFQTWQIIEDVKALTIGQSFSGSTTIGDLAGTEIGDFTVTIGELSEIDRAHAAVVVEDPPRSGVGVIRFIGRYSSQDAWLRVRMYKSAGRSRVVLKSVSLTDVRVPDGKAAAYTVQWRDDLEAVERKRAARRDPSFSDPIPPNPRNVAKIHRAMQEIDLQINVTGEFEELSHIIINTSGELGA